MDEPARPVNGRQPGPNSQQRCSTRPLGRWPNPRRWSRRPRACSKRSARRSAGSAAPCGRSTAPARAPLRRHVAAARAAVRRVLTVPAVDVRQRSRVCRAASGPTAAGLDSGRHARRELSARAVRRARGLHAAFACPILQGRRPRRDGVLQPRHPRADAELLRDDDDGGQPDRPVRRAQMGRRGARPVLHAVARPVLRRHLRRLLHPRQPGVAAVLGFTDEAELLRRRSWTSCTPTTAPPRSRADRQRLTTAATSSTSRTAIAPSDGSYKWLHWAAALHQG